MTPGSQRHSSRQQVQSFCSAAVHYLRTNCSYTGKPCRSSLPPLAEQVLLFLVEVRSRCRSVGEAAGTTSSALTNHSVVYPRTQNVISLYKAHMHAPLLKSYPLCEGHLQSQCLDPLVPGSWVSLCCDSECCRVFVHPHPIPAPALEEPLD